MRKLLWIGDAACDSGFARATHQTLEALRKTWDVTVLGLNYRGDPHDYPYPIYPAWPGGDMFGFGRVKELVQKIRPAAIVIQNDPWNIPGYVKMIEAVKDVPRPTLIGAIAIDGKNCRGWALNGLDYCIFWTQFAQYEAIRGGLTKPSGVVPLGVDLEVYKPGNRREARDLIGLPNEIKDGFFVGNVNRNQPRKRLDLTIQYFAEWITSRKIEDAYLYLHVAPTGDLGYDCDQLAAYYGLHGKMILAEPAIFSGASEEMLAKTYHAFDVQLSTTLGEGWGLTTMEGMACGIPQVVPDWSALAEWAKPAALTVPCEPVASLNKVNVIGGLADRHATIEALDLLYTDGEAYNERRRAGLALVSQECYRWPNIAAEFAAQINQVIEEIDG